MQPTNQNREELLQYLALLEEKAHRETYDKFHTYFFQDHKIDENGNDISRDKYPKHVAFLNSCGKFKESAFIGGNRSGKTEAAAFLMAMILMKDYPHWYTGKRFPDYTPLKIMMVGKTHIAVRDAAQKKLFGTFHNPGTGMIPLAKTETDCGIVEYRKKCGTPDAIQDLYVRDKFGCINHIQFMSGESNEDIVMGQELHVVWFDEECLKPKLYDELLIRTMTTEGFVINTFTPLDGITPSIKRFMPELKFPSDGIVRDLDGRPTNQFCVNIGWDDAPHLTKEMQETLRSALKGPFLISRTQGIPTIGVGQIYPLMESEYVVAPFQIPDYWPRAYGMDVGWKKTAAVWGAQDPNTGIYYIFNEYYRGGDIAESNMIRVHATNIMQMGGSWVTGAIDPASNQRNQKDGSQLLDLYTQEGLILQPAQNTTEAGISMILQLLETGMLKIFKTCQNLITEMRMYRRDDNGKIMKENDHACDAMRYLMMTGMDYAACKPNKNLDAVRGYRNLKDRNPMTGY